VRFGVESRANFVYRFDVYQFPGLEMERSDWCSFVLAARVRSKENAPYPPKYPDCHAMQHGQWPAISSANLAQALGKSLVAGQAISRSQDFTSLAKIGVCTGFGLETHSQAFPAFGRNFCARAAAYRFAKPRFTPEDRARFLATLVAAAGTAQAIEQDHVIGSECPHVGASSGRTCLYNALCDLEFLSAEVDHLRHERQVVDSALAVECLEYLVRRLDLHKIARTELPGWFHIRLNQSHIERRQSEQK
jgi:hypothetical protein